MFNTLEMPLTREFHLSAFQYATASSIYLITTVIMLIPVGIIIDRTRFTLKSIFIFALCLSATGTLIFSLSESFALLKLSLFISALGDSFCFIGSVTLINYYFSELRKGTAIGLLISIGMMGGLVAQFPMKLLLSKYNWDMIISGLFIVSLLIMLVMLCTLDTFNKQIREKRGLIKELKDILWNKKNWVYSICTSSLNLPVTLLGAIWGQIYLIQAHGLSAINASLVTSMLFIGMIIGPVIIGFFSDKLNERRKIMLFGALTITAIVFLLFIIKTNNIYVFSFLFLILGIASASQTLGYALVSENNPMDSMGVAISMIGMLVLLGGATFQPLFGHIMDTFTPIHLREAHVYTEKSFFIAMMLIPLMSLVSAILLKKQPHK